MTKAHTRAQQRRQFRRSTKADDRHFIGTGAAKRAMKGGGMPKLTGGRRSRDASVTAIALRMIGRARTLAKAVRLADPRKVWTGVAVWPPLRDELIERLEREARKRLSSFTWAVSISEGGSVVLVISGAAQ